MPTPRTRRAWTDGDSYLLLGLLVVACGVAILRHALIAENWLVLGGAIPTTYESHSDALQQRSLR